MQACERAKESIVERLKIHNAIQAKKTEYQTESLKKRLEDRTSESVNSTVDSTVKGTSLRYGYKASNNEVNFNNPCVWVRYYHRSMKAPLGSGSY